MILMLRNQGKVQGLSSLSNEEEEDTLSFSRDGETSIDAVERCGDETCFSFECVLGN